MGIRQAILIVIVLGLSLAGLVRARIGLYGYTWYALMRPDALAWAGANPYSLVLAICTLLGSLIHVPARFQVFFRNPLLVLLLLVQIPFLCSVLFAYQPALCWDALDQYMRALLMALLIPVLITTLDQLRILFLIVACSLGLIGAKYGAAGLLHGGVRFAGGYAGMISDNNFLALALSMAIPLMWFGAQTVKPKWAKLALIGMVILNAAAILMTYSRAGAVALAAAFLLIAWRSRHRVVILVALTLVTVPMALMLGQAYIDRLATLKAPTEEASALSRLVLAKAGLKLWADHPWLGVGFGRQNQQLLLPRYMPEWWGGFQGFVIHNTWIQVLTDSGIFAFLLYVLLYLSCLWWLGRVFRRSRKDQSPWAPYAAGLHTSLAAFGVGATFGSRVDFDLYYILIATVAALYEIRKNWIPAEEAAPAIPTLRPPQITHSLPVAALLDGAARESKRVRPSRARQQAVTTEQKPG